MNQLVEIRWKMFLLIGFWLMLQAASFAESDIKVIAALDILKNTASYALEEESRKYWERHSPKSISAVINV